MHNNYFFLKQLSIALRESLTGFTLVSCFSQSKDELIFEFNNAIQSFYIKASLQPQFCCLSFPKDFQRAKKNSIDLFGDIILKKVKGVRQFSNERCFSIEFDDDYALIFKMHGNRSNILLAKENGVKQIFRNHLATDFEIKINALDRNIDWSKSHFLNHLHDWKSVYFTLSKEVINHLEGYFSTRPNPEDQWLFFQHIIQQLENPRFHSCELKNKLIFSLLPLGTVKRIVDNPIEAITEFFIDYTSTEAFYTEKQRLLKQLKERLAGGRQYLSKNEGKLKEIREDHHYQEWADLLMANMHAVHQGTESVTLSSFYTGESITIKLKKELNAQKNAEVFYRKAKNQQIEIDQLTSSITRKQHELQELRQALEQIEATTDLKTLRAIYQHLGLIKKLSVREEVLPYHEFEHMGYRIWVGKNAESNDELTLKRAHKDDLWLHAKDVAGSHVIIKSQSGKKIPKPVIERAAELAAYNSKRKTETLCAVIVTPKKYVRKRKCDPAGMMVVEKEEVILVEPRL